MNRKKFNPGAVVQRASQDIGREDQSTLTLQGKNDQLRKEVEELKAHPAGVSNVLPSSLEAIEKEIRELQGLTMTAVWLMGQRFAHIREEKLFEGQYRSFNQYCEEGLSIGRRTVYNAIFIFQSFTYDKVVQSIAQPSKMYLLEPLREDQQTVKQLVEWIETENPPRGLIQSRVQEIKKAQPIAKPQTQNQTQNQTQSQSQDLTIKIKLVKGQIGLEFNGFEKMGFTPDETYGLGDMIKHWVETIGASKVAFNAREEKK